MTVLCVFLYIGTLVAVLSFVWTLIMIFMVAGCTMLPFTPCFWSIVFYSYLDLHGCWMYNVILICHYPASFLDHCRGDCHESESVVVSELACCPSSSCVALNLCQWFHRRRLLLSWRHRNLTSSISSAVLLGWTRHLSFSIISSWCSPCAWAMVLMRIGSLRVAVQHIDNWHSVWMCRRCSCSP